MKDAMERLDAARTPFLDPTPPGPNCCQVCGGGHQPDMPHNQQAAFYQDSFVKKHGRSPTWADAIAHCSETMRKAWMTALKEQDAWSEPDAGVPVIMHMGDEPAAPTEPDMKVSARSFAYLRGLGPIAKDEAIGVSIELTPQGEAEAKDIRIAELEARIRVLERELQPFADEGAKWHDSFGDDERPHLLLFAMGMAPETLAAFTLGDLRRAAKRLAGASS